MNIIPTIKQIDWSRYENRDISNQLLFDAKEYMKRVIDHIYTGNEIRSDSFMDISEKQDELHRLDSKRTGAHDKMLRSFAPFLELLKEKTDFAESDYRLSTRTQIADFIALIAFQLLDKDPLSGADGDIRNELAEKIHSGEITFEQIVTTIEDEIYDDRVLDPEYAAEYVEWVVEALVNDFMMDAESAEAAEKEYDVMRRIKECPMIAMHDDPRNIAQIIAEKCLPVPELIRCRTVLSLEHTHGIDRSRTRAFIEQINLDKLISEHPDWDHYTLAELIRKRYLKEDKEHLEMNAGNRQD